MIDTVGIRFARIEPPAGPAETDAVLLRALAIKLERLMKLEAPANKNPTYRRREGPTLKESIKVEAMPSADAAFGFYANDYVEYVLGGTKPHVIKPITEGGSLAFQWQAHLSSPRNPRSRGRGAHPSVFVGDILRQSKARSEYAQGGLLYGGATVPQRSGGIRTDTFKRADGQRISGPRLKNTAGVKRPYAPANTTKMLTAEGGTGVFFKHVNHPGAKPNNFVARALNRAEGDIRKFEEVWMDSLEERLVKEIDSSFRAFGKSV